MNCDKQRVIQREYNAERKRKSRANLSNKKIVILSDSEKNIKILNKLESMTGIEKVKADFKIK